MRRAKESPAAEVLRLALGMQESEALARIGGYHQQTRYKAAQLSPPDRKAYEQMRSEGLAAKALREGDVRRAASYAWQARTFLILALEVAPVDTPAGVLSGRAGEASYRAIETLKEALQDAPF